MLQTLFYHLKIPEVDIGGYFEQNFLKEIRYLVPYAQTENYCNRPVNSKRLSSMLTFPDHVSSALKGLHSSNCSTLPASWNYPTIKPKLRHGCTQSSYFLKALEVWKLKKSKNSSTED
jgi:hypothetical protein